MEADTTAQRRNRHRNRDRRNPPSAYQVIERPLSSKERFCDDRQNALPEVKIRSYRESPICDVVVVVHGTEMALRCPDYRQAKRWARLERKSCKIPVTDIDVAAKVESQELPLFLRSEEIDLCSARNARKPGG